MTTCLGKSYSVNCTCLSWALVKFCVCSSFPFGIECGMWDVIVLILIIASLFTLQKLKKAYMEWGKGIVIVFGHQLILLY